MKHVTYDAFPWTVVVLCSGVGLSIYAIGLYLMAGLGLAWSVLYLLYCGWVEYRILWMSCRHCAYFGKLCAFGKGKVCSWLFTPLASEVFMERQITWRDMVPDFLVSLIPLGVGIILLVRRFNWGVILLMVVLFLLSSVGTGLIRGCLACRYCRQREIGCPAERLFRKSQKV